MAKQNNKVSDKVEKTIDAEIYNEVHRTETHIWYRIKPEYISESRPNEKKVRIDETIEPTSEGYAEGTEGLREE